MRRFSPQTSLLLGWSLISCLATVGISLARLHRVAANPAAWRALAVPMLAATMLAWSAHRISRGIDEFAILRVVLLSQVASFSLGPVAYRLIAGPYVMLNVTPGSFGHLWAGADVSFFLLFGRSNRVPEGIAVNIAALVVLAVSGAPAARRSIAQPPAVPPNPAC